MTKSQRVRIVVLCEDLQTEVFVRRFFDRRHNIRTPVLNMRPAPRALGDPRPWLRQRFVEEIRTLRATSVAAVLVAVIDADTVDPASRKAEFDRACREAGVEPRQATDPVAILVPQRAIETWIDHLEGKAVDETTSYPHRPRNQRSCYDAVDELVRLCREHALDDSAPPSLLDACTEYDARIRPHL